MNPKPVSTTAPTVSAASAKIEKPATIQPANAEWTPEQRAQHRQEILARAVQHHPAPIGALGPTEYERCVCGFTLARYEGRTYWIRVKGHSEKPPILDVTDAEDLAYALRTKCNGGIDWLALTALRQERKALKQQKSHPEPA